MNRKNRKWEDWEIRYLEDNYETGSMTVIEMADRIGLNYSQVSRHKKAHFYRGAGYFVCSQYKASASFGVSILSVPCGLFVL